MINEDSSIFYIERKARRRLRQTVLDKAKEVARIALNPPPFPRRQ
jgi:hypothetical protein